MDNVNDLFASRFHKGTVDALSPVTEFFVPKSIAFISFCGFFITWIHVFKLAIAGIYLSQPSWWNSVSEMKESLRRTEGLKIGSAEFSFIAKFFGNLIPDVKKISGIDGTTVKASDYFTKAGVSSAVGIFLGVLTFNGGAVDMARIVAMSGNAVVQKIIQVDPTLAVEKFLNMAATPKTGSEVVGSEDVQFAIRVSKEIYNTVITTYPAAAKKSAQAKALMDNIFKTVLAEIESDPLLSANVGQTQQWNNKYQVSYSSGKLTGVDSFNGKFKEDPQSKAKIYYVLKDMKMKDLLPEMAGVDDNDYVSYTMGITEIVGGKVSNVELAKASLFAVDVTVNGNNLVFTIPAEYRANVSMKDVRGWSDNNNGTYSISHNAMRDKLSITTNLDARAVLAKLEEQSAYSGIMPSFVIRSNSTTKDLTAVPRKNNSSMKVAELKLLLDTKASETPATPNSPGAPPTGDKPKEPLSVQ